VQAPTTSFNLSDASYTQQILGILSIESVTFLTVSNNNACLENMQGAEQRHAQKDFEMATPSRNQLLKKRTVAVGTTLAFAQ